MARLRGRNHQPPARAGPLNDPTGWAYVSAVTHWLDAQLYVSEREDLLDRDRVLENRITAGRVWLQEHRGHEREGRNRGLLATLEWERRLLQFQIADRLLAIRVAVWSVWCCWEHLTASERATLEWETGLADLSGPEAIWQRLGIEDVELGRLPIVESTTWWTNEKAHERLAEWERAS